MKLPRRSIVVLAVLAAGADAALAQAHGGGGGHQSLLKMIISGFEWPAFFIMAGSIVAISLIVEHFVTVRRSTIGPSDQIKKSKAMIESRDFRGCLDMLQKSRTFFARVMTASLQHARHGFDAMHDAAVEKAGELSGRMFRKVEYLNIIGNLGPLMGLLGTVLGMIYAFQGLSAGGGGGDASAGQLAQGISLALVNTLLGLSLAVAGIGFFGVCRNRIDSLTVEATVETLDLLEYFRPGVSSRSAGPAAGTAEPAARRSTAAAGQPKAARGTEEPAGA